MYPFNVKIINVCTGTVKSNIAANATQNYDHSLPPGSVYLPIEEKLKHAQDAYLGNSIDAKDYAEYVVNKVNSSTKSGWIWKGAFSTIIWFVSTFLWKTVFDLIQLKETGLKELQNSVMMMKKEKKKKGVE